MTGPEPPRPPLDLRRPRDVAALLADGFSLYFRELGTFLLIAIAVVVPVNLIVLGVGLGWLTGSYDKTPSLAAQLIPVATQFLVAVPLLNAMSIYALLDASQGERPRAASAIQRGLDVFAPVLLVAILYLAGMVVGCLLLIVPGIYLAVRWIFWAQTTVIDGRRGYDAVRRSGELVQGAWWRVAGIALAAGFVVGGLTSIVGAPFLALANKTGHAFFQLIGQTLGGVLFAPAAALIMTLLYFDLRLRRGV